MALPHLLSKTAIETIK